MGNKDVIIVILPLSFFFLVEAEKVIVLRIAESRKKQAGLFILLWQESACLLTKSILVNRKYTETIG